MKKKTTIEFIELSEMSSIDFVRKKWKRLKDKNEGNDCATFVYRQFAIVFLDYGSVDERFELTLIQNYKASGNKRLEVQDCWGKTINGVMRELETKLLQIAALVR